MNDVNILDELPIAPGAYYVMDRGYNDFKRLCRIDRENASFVVRAKKNTKVRRIYSRPVDKSTGLRCDQIVVFTVYRTRKLYSHKIRRVKYYDEEHKRRLVFLTNSFDLPALAVADLYKKRWQVELFFKWIKQNLRVKRFFGQSEMLFGAKFGSPLMSICSWQFYENGSKSTAPWPKFYTFLTWFHLKISPFGRYLTKPQLPK